MSGASYYLKLFNAQGVPVLDEIKDFTDLEVALKENDRGMLKLALATELLEGLPIDRDWRLEAWRAIDQRPPKLVGNTCFFIRRYTRKKSGGLRTARLEGYNGVSLLARRGVAYPEKTAYTEKEGPADDVIKAFVRENLGGLVVDGDRDWSATITVADDEGLAPVVKVEGARKNLLSVLQQAADMSYEQGTYLAFDMVYDPLTGGFLFQTFVNQRGVDRTEGSDNPIVLSDETDQLEDVELEDNWTNEGTFVYEIGKGSGPARPVGTAQDDDLIAASPYGRIEIFHSSGQISTEDALNDAADATLQKAKATTKMKAKFVDTPGRRFGVDFYWGDMVTVQAEGKTSNARLHVVGLKVDADGEQVDIQLENVA